MLYFPGEEPPHKEFEGSDPNWGDLGGISLCLCWKGLNGVGVDGVGGIFPFSSLFFRFPSLFFAFVLILLRQEQTTAIYWGNGEFHSYPVCTDPVQNFPIMCFFRS